MHTCVVLAILTHPTPSHLVALRERVHAGVISTRGGMPVTTTRLTGEPVERSPVTPGLVLVSGQTALTVRALGVVFTLAYGVDLRTTATSVAITGTSGVWESRVH